jgi:hypothetical protein
LAGLAGRLVLLVAVVAVLAFVPAEGGSVALCPWLDQTQPVAQRVGELISAMTLDEKIAEMHVFRDVNRPLCGL